MTGVQTCALPIWNVGKGLLGLERPDFFEQFLGKRLGNACQGHFGAGDFSRPVCHGFVHAIDMAVGGLGYDYNLHGSFPPFITGQTRPVDPPR